VPNPNGVLSQKLCDSQNGNENYLHHKCQAQDCQNKDRLSVYTIVQLQRKPNLGRTKPSTGPHAAHGPRLDKTGLTTQERFVEPVPWEDSYKEISELFTGFSWRPYEKAWRRLFPALQKLSERRR